MPPLTNSATSGRGEAERRHRDERRAYGDDHGHRGGGDEARHHQESAADAEKPGQRTDQNADADDPRCVAALQPDVPFGAAPPPYRH
jgi:hypothetical protein